MPTGSKNPSGRFPPPTRSGERGVHAESCSRPKTQANRLWGPGEPGRGREDHSQDKKFPGEAVRRSSVAQSVARESEARLPVPKKKGLKLPKGVLQFAEEPVPSGSCRASSQPAGLPARRQARSPPARRFGQSELDHGSPGGRQAVVGRRSTGRLADWPAVPGRFARAARRNRTKASLVAGRRPAGFWPGWQAGRLAVRPASTEAGSRGELGGRLRDGCHCRQHAGGGAGSFWLFCAATFFGGAYAAVVLSFRFAATASSRPGRAAG